MAKKKSKAKLGLAGLIVGGLLLLGSFISIPSLLGPGEGGGGDGDDKKNEDVEEPDAPPEQPPPENEFRVSHDEIYHGSQRISREEFLTRARRCKERPGFVKITLKRGEFTEGWWTDLKNALDEDKVPLQKNLLD
ncbi:MAG: hypothetical protein HY720_19860 [Planctomycetes bacterium]|nr:hypothetical protein [Planctomycetota bacterium]